MIRPASEEENPRVCRADDAPPGILSVSPRMSLMPLHWASARARFMTALPQSWLRICGLSCSPATVVLPSGGPARAGALSVLDEVGTVRHALEPGGVERHGAQVGAVRRTGHEVAVRGVAVVPGQVDVAVHHDVIHRAGPRRGDRAAGHGPGPGVDGPAAGGDARAG